MRLLREMSLNIQNLIGYQKYDKHKEYIVSIYNVMIEVDDGILLYNHFSKAIILLKNKEELIPNDLLVSNQFYFDININQYKFLNNTFQKYRESHYSNHLDPLNLVILNTYRCNANCPYCFEVNRNHTKNMSEQVALDTAKQICSNINHDVRLQFFGGEPSTNLKAIDLITNYLNENFKYDQYIEMTSNGYLLKDVSAEHMYTNQRLRRIDITLDGLKDTYNRIKRYHNLEVDAFTSVTEVIEKLLLHDVRVRIGCNVSPTNYWDIHCVIQYISNRFKNLPYEFVVHPLFETEAMKFTEFELNQMANNYISLVNELSAQSDYEINELDSLKFFNCTADSGNGCSITPDGNIAICENDAENAIIGNIYKCGIQNYNSIEKFREIQEYDRCQFCLLKPSCISLRACDGDSKWCTKPNIDFRILQLKKSLRNQYYRFLGR